jgi:tyrosyl-tRNA synthetase
MEEVREYGRLKGADLRKSKETLAFEATKIVHGEKEAVKAKEASKALFSGKGGKDGGSIPTTYMDKEKFIQGIPLFKLFETANLCTSGSEARRLIEQGGAYINNRRVDKFDEQIKLEDFDSNGTISLRVGKKKYHRIKIKTP